MSKIQGHRLQGSVSSMDFNANNRFFAAGGKQTIKIIQFATEKQYWFQCKKSIAKHKGAIMTKTCVSELAWNKYGSDYIAVGTTSGYVLVYDVGSSSTKNLLLAKGHDGNIKNVIWVPQSQSEFLSSSYQNQINVWDVRKPQPNVNKQNYPQSVKIRDIKFNPNDPNYIAVQCSTKIQIFDFRKLDEPVLTKQIKDNQLQGYIVQWDPHNKFRLASGISKQINILDWEGNNLKKREELLHYSLIKSFKWLKTQPNLFGISGEHPQKNICFYDIQDKDRVSYMYGGHNRSIDCWMMNSDQTIILSASNVKQKKQNNSSLKMNLGFIVAQSTDNFINPNQARLDYPLNFDNNSSFAFSISIQDPLLQKKSGSQQQNFNQRKKKTKFTFPTVYNLTEEISGGQFHDVKSQIQYFHKRYITQGRNQLISENNSKVALNAEKKLCSQFWKNIFTFVYPEQGKEHTIESIYQDKLKVDVVFLDNRIIFNNRHNIKRQVKKINITELIQYIADQNQLQTAVIACIVLINKNPSLIPEDFFHNLLTSYIQILRNLQLYTIASETILSTKLEIFTQVTTVKTLYNITCGWCKQSVTKGNCKCNMLCVLCHERLNERMVIWCKYCGHGGHAKEYYKWFKIDKKRQCPHGCGHECFQNQSLSK